MTSLIEGYFRLTGARPFSGGSAAKAYLTVYDSCAALGLMSEEVFIDTELRVYSQGLDGMVVHLYGRFSVVPAIEEEDPYLLIEVHRFIATNINPFDSTASKDRCTSVAVSGQVAPLTNVTGEVESGVFMLEVNEFIRDRNQLFTIRFATLFFLPSQCFLMESCRCRLDKTGNKRWENTNIPSIGSTVMISGYLEGQEARAFLIEVETMGFITPYRGGNVAGNIQTLGQKSSFGIPKRFVHVCSDFFSS